MTNAEYVSITASDWRAARYLMNHCRAVDASRNRLYENDIPYPIERAPRARRRPPRGSLPLFAGRWLATVKISARDWLRIVELYTSEKPAAAIAADVGLGYPIAQKALEAIQRAIAGRGYDTTNDSTVYGIRPSPASGASLEEIARDRIVIKLDFRHAQLIFARKEVEYRSLLWSQNVLETADSGKLAMLYRIFSSDGDYWSFSKERLLKYHGVSFDKLPFYLDEIKEIDFKWTHRGEPLFDAVIGRLCDYAPDPARTECA